MEKWIVSVETNCNNPTRLDEFNKWYDHVHVPDVLGTPGMMRGNRYEFIMPWKPGSGPVLENNHESSENQAGFLVLYEVEAEDITETLKLLDKNMDKKIWCDATNVVSMRVYRQISSRLK